MNEREAGNLPESSPSASTREGIQAWRGILSLGLWLLPLDFASFEIDHDTGSSNDGTYTPKINGTALCSAVPFETDNDTTADNLVAAINANAANHRYWAIKGGAAEVIIYQRRWNADGVAIALTVTVTVDAAVANLTDFTDEGSIDAIEVTTQIPDTYLFYELAARTTSAYDLLETGTPRIGEIRLTLGGAWKWFHGMFNAASETYASIVRTEVAASTEKKLPSLSSMGETSSGATGYVIAPDVSGGPVDVENVDLMYI